MPNRREIKERVFQFLCRLGVHHVNRRRNARRLLIVMYHGIVADNAGQPNSWLLLPVSKFREQIDYLRRFYRVLPMAHAAEQMAAGARWRRPTACITFDDGYRNNYELAFPILERHRLPATIYLPTGAMGNGEPHWTIRLERAFVRTQATSLDLSAEKLGRYDLPALADAAYVALKSHLYRINEIDRQELLRAIFKQLGDDSKEDYSAFATMTWQDAKRMAASGLVDFGGHTIRHQITSALTEAGVREEVCGSMQDIARHLGVAPKTFAYPNGTARDFSELAKLAVKESGGVAALTTVEGLNLATADRYALRRMAIDAKMSLAEFKLLTSGLLTELRSRRDRLPWSPF